MEYVVQIRYEFHGNPAEFGVWISFDNKYHTRDAARWAMGKHETYPQGLPYNAFSYELRTHKLNRWGE